jgi:hypothetical protein
MRQLAPKRVGFSGWAIVDPARVPGPSRTATGRAAIARDYLQRELRFTIRGSQP